MNFDHTAPFYINKSYIGLKYMTNFSPYKRGLVILPTDSVQGSKQNAKQALHRICHNATQVIINNLKRINLQPFHFTMLKHILKYSHLLHCFSYSKLNPFLPSVSPNKIDCSSQIKTKFQYQYHQSERQATCPYLSGTKQTNIL